MLFPFHQGPWPVLWLLCGRLFLIVSQATFSLLTYAVLFSVFSGVCWLCSYLFPLDRVVDDLNPMLNFTRKEVENLLHFVEKEPAPQTSLDIKGIKESVLQLACLKYPHLITKVNTWWTGQPWYGRLRQWRLVWQTCFLLKWSMHMHGAEVIFCWPHYLHPLSGLWSVELSQPCPTIWPLNLPNRRRK